jgi:hypothetical protein
MPIYKPEIKVYYGPISDEANRLIPGPDISISTEYVYSNDSIIGYAYIFEINGQATALDLRDIEYGGEYSEPENYNMGAVVDHINKLRSTLSKNGEVLRIVDGQTDSIILEARGGILRSFSFNETENNWTHYASYSASLEFSSVDFGSSTESCDEVFLDPDSFPDGEPGIADINAFKVKNFSDSWSFSFSENESFNRAKVIDSDINLNLNNVSFNIEYSINAVGKNFYVYEEENTTKLLPAWEQAKNFVQYRLHAQVTNLINNVLKNPYEPCVSSDTLKDIHLQDSPGLLSSLGDSKYKIYNEEITCEASESEGSFSASYSATVRSSLGNQQWADPSATHTVQKSVKSSVDSNGTLTKSISVNGTIQGLIEGGLIRNYKGIELPNQGAIKLLNNISDSKYNNAKIVLDKIYNVMSYNEGKGQCGKKDLDTNFKNVLGINIASLDIGKQKDDPIPCPSEEENDCIIPDPPHPASFNLTHDYINGTITYSVDYNSNDNNCNNGSNAKFTQINIQTSQPNKVTAAFNIPNSQKCAIIQELGTFTSKTVNITIAGTDNSCIGKPTKVDFNTLINCGFCDTEGYFPIKLPSEENVILTQKQYSNNPVDGSFTINLGYICAEGCFLPKLGEY